MNINDNINGHGYSLTWKKCTKEKINCIKLKEISCIKLSCVVWVALICFGVWVFPWPVWTCTHRGHQAEWKSGCHQLWNILMLRAVEGPILHKHSMWLLTLYWSPWLESQSLSHHKGLSEKKYDWSPWIWLGSRFFLKKNCTLRHMNMNMNTTDPHEWS